MRCILFFLFVFNLLRTFVVIYCCIWGKKNQWLACSVCSQRRNHIRDFLLVNLDFCKSSHLGDLSSA